MATLEQVEAAQQLCPGCPANHHIMFDGLSTENVVLKCYQNMTPDQIKAEWEKFKDCFARRTASIYSLPLPDKVPPQRPDAS